MNSQCPSVEPWKELLRTPIGSFLAPHYHSSDQTEFLKLHRKWYTSFFPSTSAFMWSTFKSPWKWRFCVPLKFQNVRPLHDTYTCNTTDLHILWKILQQELWWAVWHKLVMTVMAQVSTHDKRLQIPSLWCIRGARASEHIFPSSMAHICIAFRSHVLSNPAVRAICVWAVFATKFAGHESLRSLRLGPPKTSRELHQRTCCSGVTSGRCCFRDYM